MFTDCARFLQVYDTELILSWTPREYRAFIKGAQHREIDQYERMANGAMFNSYAANAKRATVKKMFDADKARKKVERNDMDWKGSRQKTSKWEVAKMALDSLKGYTPSFTTKKGG